MKKLLSLLIAFTLIFASCFVGFSIQANALEVSPEADFLFFDGVIEEYIGPGGTVVIPSEIEGEKVLEIAANAFSGNPDIQEVYFPEGLEIIGRRAFMNCSNLIKVSLPYSLQELRASTFAGCALESVVIPGNVDFIGNWCFSGCNLTEITISYGVRRILDQAFCGNPACDVVFPETVEVIMASAFSPMKDKERATYTFCNPDIEWGVCVDGQSEKACENSEWNGHYAPVFASPHGNVNYRIVVPDGSKLHKFLKEETNSGKTLLDKAGGNYATCSYTIVAENEAYFDELEANQKDWGITEKTNNTWGSTGSANNSDGANGDGATNNGDGATNGGSENGTQSNNKNPSSNKNNQNGQQTIVEEGDSSTTWLILGIVGGFVILLIAGVTIFLIFFLKKPAKKNNDLTDEEMMAVLQARMAAKEETEPEKPAETEE